MSSKRYKKQQGKHRQKRRAATSAWKTNDRHHVTNQGQHIVSDEQDVTLQYAELAELNSAGNGGIARRWTPNGAFDIDPVLGSASVAGFAEWSAFYDYYRVIRYSYEISVANIEGVPVDCFVINTNVDPTTSITSWISYSTAPHAAHKLLGLSTSGQANWRARGSYSVAQILGSKAPEYDDSYRALVTANPADLIWLGIGIQVAGSGVLTYGVSIDVRITLHLRFYGRRLGITSLKTVPATADELRQVVKRLEEFESNRQRKKLENRVLEVTKN